ncbi:MAG: MBL fold metallo-hydrolase RNA specificity domain-containing protein [candidate division WOR-3 bacterium]
MLLTRPTRQFFEERLGSRTQFTELEFERPFQLGASRATLFPAGHILGSAQILVENRQRIVYTGDFRLRPNPATENVQIRQCDTLIMEATFGRPQYVFPGNEEVEQQLKREIDSCLNSRVVPIIRAYALGKAQEVIVLLNRLGYRVAVDPTTRRYCDIYEANGIRLGEIEILPTTGQVGSESVDWGRAGYHGLVFVVGARAALAQLLARYPRRRVMFVTGWGVDANAARRFGVDVVIPLSDHADYFDLIQYVEMAQPREVLITHGAPEFARDLRNLGFSARFLG